MDTEARLEFQSILISAKDSALARPANETISPNLSSLGLIITTFMHPPPQKKKSLSHTHFEPWDCIEYDSIFVCNNMFFSLVKFKQLNPFYWFITFHMEFKVSQYIKSNKFLKNVDYKYQTKYMWPVLAKWGTMCTV